MTPNDHKDIDQTGWEPEDCKIDRERRRDKIRNAPIDRSSPEYRALLHDVRLIAIGATGGALLSTGWHYSDVTGIIDTEGCLFIMALMRMHQQASFMAFNEQSHIYSIRSATDALFAAGVRAKI